MKRFTETLKWADPWFRRLSGEAKMLWIYILDHCDNIGLAEIDLDLAGRDCGFSLQIKHLLEIGDRIQQTDCGKVFLPKFIGFQYGRLSPSCPAHKRVIEAIERHGLIEQPLGYAYPNARVAIPKKTVQDRNKTGQEEDAREIEELWQLFPATSRNRSSKQKLADALAKTKSRPPMGELAASAQKWAACHEWTKDGGQYAPGAHIWIKDRKWESEPISTPQINGKPKQPRNILWD